MEQVLLGHKDEIDHVIELNDGCLASASDDGTIRIWKEKDNSFKCDQVLRKQTKKILSLLQINNYLISVSLDHTLCLWQKNQDVWEYKSIVNDAHGHYFSNAIKRLENHSFATLNQQGKVLIWAIENEELKLLQTIDNKTANHCFLAKEYLVIMSDSDYTIAFYENIRGRWEFVTSLNLQTDGNNFSCFNFLQDGRIAIISWKKCDNQFKYYLTIYQKNILNSWDKFIIFLVQTDITFNRFEVIDNKILLEFGNNLLILENADHLKNEAINYKTGIVCLVYQDPELIKQQKADLIQRQAAELVAQQAREDNNKAMAEQLKKEQVKQQEPEPQPVEIPPAANDSSDKALLLAQGKKKKKDIKCIIS